MNENHQTAPGIPNHVDDVVFRAGDPNARRNRAPQVQQAHDQPLPEDPQNQPLPDEPQNEPLAEEPQNEPRPEEPLNPPMPAQPDNPPQPAELLFIPQRDPSDNQLAIEEVVYPQPEPPRDMPLLNDDEVDEDLEDFGPFGRGRNVPNGPNDDDSGSLSIIYHGEIDVSMELAEEALSLGAAAAAATVVCVREHKPEAFTSLMQEATSVMGREDVVSDIDWSTVSYSPAHSILAGPAILIRVAQPGELQALASDREVRERRQREAYERALGIEIAEDEAPGAAAPRDDAPAMDAEGPEPAGFDAPIVKDQDDPDQGAGPAGAQPQGSALPDFQEPRAPAPGAELANAWAAGSECQDPQQQDGHAAVPSGSLCDHEELVPEFDD